MVKVFKLKYVIILMLALGLFISAAAFTVSYAKWGGTDSATLSANAGTGEWKQEEDPLPEYTYGVAFEADGKTYSVNIEELLVNQGDGVKWFAIRTIKGEQTSRFHLGFGNQRFESVSVSEGSDGYVAVSDFDPDSGAVTISDQNSEYGYYGDDVFLIAVNGNRVEIRYQSTGEVFLDNVLDMNAFVG